MNIFYTETLTRKLDFRSLFMSATSEKCMQINVSSQNFSVNVIFFTRMIEKQEIFLEFSKHIV